jgi:hypothetical protein
MFSGAFGGAFAGRGAVVGVGAFASAFAGCFAGRGGAVVVPVGFIGPMRAQAVLTDGGAWSVLGSGLVVGGALLIGPAGKVFAFVSSESAARWVDNAKNIGVRERALTLEIAAAVASWRAKKREKLAVIAGRLVDAAARQHDEAKRAALLAESDYCLAKW